MVSGRLTRTRNWKIVVKEPVGKNIFVVILKSGLLRWSSRRRYSLVLRPSCAPGEEGLVHVVFACVHKLEGNRGNVSMHAEPTLFRISSR